MKAIVNVIFASALMITLGCNNYNSGFLRISNNSDKRIIEARIIVCGQLLIFNNIEPRSEAGSAYKVTSDSSYDVTVVYADGQELKSKVGYITHGVDYNDAISIYSDHMSIKTNMNFPNE